jgi:hypothetical protein
MKYPITFVAGLLLLCLLAGGALGADANRFTHCDSTGSWCESDCDPLTGFNAKWEDQPCFLIQSSSSDWSAPTLALLVKDYR